MATGLTYDSNSLQTANIVTEDIDHFDLPAKDAKAYGLAHANRSKIPFVSYPSKIIKITGTLSDTSISAVDTLVDTFKGYFIGQDKNLDIDYAGSTRRYIATVNSISIKRPGGLAWATFEVEFICTLPFGETTANTTILNVSGRTNSSYSDNYTFAGNAPTQWPVFTVTYTALSANATDTVIIANDTTGQAISVTRAWLVNDVLEIDVVNKTVKVNGTPVDFSGAFPEFAPGAQTIDYSDTFISRTFSYNIVYNKLYL